MNFQDILPEDLCTRLDLDRGSIEGRPAVERYLADLNGVFYDDAAYTEALKRENSLLYRVVGVEPAQNDGALHYGIGILMPGKVGDEYYMTKGHLHTWRQAAEVYVGFKGNGRMILEDEATGETRLVSLAAGEVVYVPGHTAHRTANVGDDPLVYLGIYPAAAGHDYGAIAEKNFRYCLVDRGGEPTLIERA